MQTNEQTPTELFIINPETFKGTIINTMPYVNVESRNGKDILNHTYVHYTGETFKDYNAKHENKLIAITWDKFESDYYRPFLNSLCTPFKETTKDDFWDGLECLPPKRWTQNKDNDCEFFFVGECTTADLYTCFVRKGEKYFVALRSIYTKNEDLFNLN